MKIKIKAKPNSKTYSIEKTADDEFAVSVKEPPVHGLANQAITKLIAEYFGVSIGRVRIISGFTSRNKIVEII